MNRTIKIYFTVMIAFILVASGTLFYYYTISERDNSAPHFSTANISINFGKAMYTDQNNAQIYVNMTTHGNTIFSEKVYLDHCGLLLTYIGSTSVEAHKNASFKPFKTVNPKQGIYMVNLINTNISSKLLDNLTHFNAYIYLNISFNVSHQVLTWNFKDFSNIFHRRGNFSEAPNGYYVISGYSFGMYNNGIKHPVGPSEVAYCSNTPVVWLDRLAS